MFDFDDRSESPNDAPDTITDFGMGDVIDLRDVDANSTTPENDDFVFISNGAFSGMAGEIRTQDDGMGGTQLQGDTNGDGMADFVINVNGMPAFGPENLLGVIFTV